MVLRTSRPGCHCSWKERSQESLSVHRLKSVCSLVLKDSTERTKVIWWETKVGNFSVGSFEQYFDSCSVLYHRDLFSHVRTDREVRLSVPNGPLTLVNGCILVTYLPITLGSSIIFSVLYCLCLTESLTHMRLLLP